MGGMVDGGEKFFKDIRRSDGEGGRVDAGVAADGFRGGDGAVDDELDGVVRVVHEAEDADGAGGDIEIFLHIRRVGEGQARHAELLRQVPGLEDLLPFQHEQVKLRLLPVAEEEVFADLLAEHLLDGLAGLDGVGVVMIDAEIGDAEAAQQVIAALLLRQARSAVGRAAGIAGGIDVHGKNQPLRMNRSAASTPFS